MRIVTNQKLVQQNRKWAQYLFFFSFALLIVGLLVSNRPLATETATWSDVLINVVLPIMVLPVAFIATMLSVRMTNLWARHPRPDEALRDGLKGLNPKSVLYSYYHFPSRHVLITPQAVYAIVTRFQDGNIVNSGKNWKQKRSGLRQLLGVFRFDGLGDPAGEAEKAVNRVQSIFESIGVDVEVIPLIAFVDPRVQVEVENPAVQVVHASPKHPLSIKDFVLKVGKDRKSVITPDQISQFEQASGIVS
jgi:hypothetical protein